MWIVEHYSVRWWTKPFVIFGVNPIVAFVGSGVMARLIYTLWKVDYAGKSQSILQSVIYQCRNVVSALTFAARRVAGVCAHLSS